MTLETLKIVAELDKRMTALAHLASIIEDNEAAFFEVTDPGDRQYLLGCILDKQCELFTQVKEL